MAQTVRYPRRQQYEPTTLAIGPGGEIYVGGPLNSIEKRFSKFHRKQLIDPEIEPASLSIRLDEKVGTQINSDFVQTNGNGDFTWAYQWSSAEKNSYATKDLCSQINDISLHQTAMWIVVGGFSGTLEFHENSS